VVAETNLTREVIRRSGVGGDATLVAHPWSRHVQPLCDAWFAGEWGCPAIAAWPACPEGPPVAK
jgi:hypothetical protein